MATGFVNLNTVPGDPGDKPNWYGPPPDEPMGGIINPRPPKELDLNVANSGPTLGTVNIDTDTVSGQLDAILGRDSPYLTRARASSTQAMNRRGLINTTMAGQAGEAAAIDAALPIASQDASTFSTQRLANQGASNQFGLQELSGEQALANIGKQAEETRTTAETTARLETGLQAERAKQISELSTQQAGEGIELQTLRGTQAQALADTEAMYKTILQTSASGSMLFGESMKQMTAVLNDSTTAPEVKAGLLENLQQMLEASLAFLSGTSNLDLLALLDFSTP